MNRWRHHKLHKLGRILILVLLLGQSALLIHESNHSVALGDIDCQVCLHAQPNIAAGDIMPAMAVQPGPVSRLAVPVEQLAFFPPVYANSSRAPPLG